MSDRYFVVKLTDGSFLDFNRRCDIVNYSDNNYVAFKATKDPNNRTCLAIVPHKSIFAITSHKKENY